MYCKKKSLELALFGKNGFNSPMLSFVRQIFFTVQTPLLLAVSLSAPVFALDSEIEREWQQREKTDFENQQKRLEDATPPKQLPTPAQLAQPPVEEICFDISEIKSVNKAFPWVIGLGKLYLNQCIGRQGIALYLRAINKELLARGYATSRAALPQQDLSSGVLELVVQTGTLEEVEFPESYGPIWRHALPMTEGEVLNIRDLEQGLDQFNRLPSQNVDLKILPGSKPGQSKIVANVNQSKKWSFGLSLDDSGSESTGVHQLSINASSYNLFMLQDLVTVTKSGDADDDHDAGNNSASLSIEMPFGYWNWSLSASESDSTQLVQGDVQSFISSTTSKDISSKLSQVVFRDNATKASWYFQVKKRKRRNFINDTVVEVQSRDLSNIELGVNHRYFFGRSVVDSTFSIHQGVDWFNAEKKDASAPSSVAQPDYRFYSLSSSLNSPFSLFDRPVSFSSQFRFQQAETTLYSLDWFSNGGRYTVRGFAPSESLGAADGWRFRNDLNIPIQSIPITAYIGWDFGRVTGQGAKGLSDRTLMGLALGFKWQKFGAKIESFIAQPIVYTGPAAKSECCEISTSLSWQY